jgi:hypothetical protein
MAARVTTKQTKVSTKRAQARTMEVDQEPSDKIITGPAWAVWILSRFPGVRYRYQVWGRTKRVIIAILLYLVALPIIPIIVAAVWYAKDPEGFKKSPLMPVLVAVIAAWLGGFGYIANQTPVTDGSPYASVKPSADGESETVNNSPAATASKASKDKIAKQQTSKSTNGRQFENCTAAFDEGVFDIKRNDPSYERRLDRDNDGIACEK